MRTPALVLILARTASRRWQGSVGGVLLAGRKKKKRNKRNLANNPLDFFIITEKPRGFSAKIFSFLSFFFLPARRTPPTLPCHLLLAVHARIRPTESSPSRSPPHSLAPDLALSDSGNRARTLTLATALSSPPPQITGESYIHKTGKVVYPLRLVLLYVPVGRVRAEVA